MNKIFEIRGWFDGGPNDKGFLKGYIRSSSKEQAIKTLGIKDGFTSVYEISEKEFNDKKNKAWKNYLLYKNV